MRISRRHYKRLSHRAAAVSADLLRSYDGQVSPPSPPQAVQACFVIFPAPRHRKKVAGAFFVVSWPNCPNKKSPRESGGERGRGYSVFCFIRKSKDSLANSSSGIAPAAFFISSSSSSENALPIIRFLSGCSVSSKSSVISCHRFSGMFVQDSQLLTEAKETLSLSANSVRLMPSFKSHVRKRVLLSSSFVVTSAF